MKLFFGGRLQGGKNKGIARKMGPMIWMNILTEDGERVRNHFNLFKGRQNLGEKPINVTHWTEREDKIFCDRMYKT